MNLLRWCTDPIKDRSLFNVFSGFRLRITLVLFSNHKMLLLKYLCPSHSISFLEKLYLEEFILMF